MTTSTDFTLQSEHACFGGVQRFYRHFSEEVGLPMGFGVYLPPQASKVPVPALVFLAGLTCTEETFAFKAGAQRVASELGLALITPDTSPRGAGIVGEADHSEFGVGAGFYLDATQAPWSGHWCMESYLLRELLPRMAQELPLDGQRIGITGHSMGGHGALTIALRNPGRFASVSAFSPIVSPLSCPWGEKALTGYLGPDRAAWAQYDACELIKDSRFHGEILIDQGLADKFLDEQLKPELFEAACKASGHHLKLRQHAEYDHSYWFIQTFIEQHLRFHAEVLTRGS